MRLLTVTHFFEAHGGGIERVAGHLSRTFAAQGHTPVWAASATDFVPQEIEAVRLRCFNGIERLTGLPLPILHPGAIAALATAVAEADAVIVHDCLYMTSVVAAMAARRLGKPLLIVQHVAEIPFSQTLLRWTMRVANRLVTRTMLRSADQVAFISATTREAFRHVAMRRPPLTLFNGIAGDVFNPSFDTDRDATRRTLSLPMDRRVILFVGRFVKKKGLAIIAALARRRPDLHFALAGHGPIDPTRWHLSNVTVLRGLSGDRLAALYRAADLLLLPSVGEGFPLVIQEAMACGLRVICGSESARADPGATRWLTGIDVEIARPDETAARASRAIDTLALAPGPDIEMARYALDTYSWERMATSLAAALASVSMAR